jgi:hypothetical protein
MIGYWPTSAVGKLEVAGRGVAVVERQRHHSEGLPHTHPRRDPANR